MVTNMGTNLRFPVAIHILTLLAASGTELLTSEQIASSVDTNPAFARRIMALLRKHGMVESHPGVKGGWRLRYSPARMTLRKVYHAVQQDDLLALHAHPNPDCPVGGHIRDSLHRIFAQAETALQASLSRQTIAEVLKDVRSRSVSQA